MFWLFAVLCLTPVYMAEFFTEEVFYHCSCFSVPSHRSDVADAEQRLLYLQLPSSLLLNNQIVIFLAHKHKSLLGFCVMIYGSNSFQYLQNNLYDMTMLSSQASLYVQWTNAIVWCEGSSVTRSSCWPATRPGRDKPCTDAWFWRYWRKWSMCEISVVLCGFRCLLPCSQGDKLNWSKWSLMALKRDSPMANKWLNVILQTIFQLRIYVVLVLIPTVGKVLKVDNAPITTRFSSSLFSSTQLLAMSKK